MKIEYQCSNCGKLEKTSAMVGIPEGMFALGYRAVGDALYCPDCVNSWAERNGKPFDEVCRLVECNSFKESES